MVDNLNLDGLQSIDEAPASSAIDVSGLTPIDEASNGDSSSGSSNSDPWHTSRMLAGDLLRAPANATLGIVDAAARVPTWAYNTLRPSGSAAVDYPPSLNKGIQDKLSQYLPEPKNPQEQVLSSGMRNAAFGPAGVVGGMAASGVQQQPYGQDNLSLGGRDLGISPNDIVSGLAGATAAGSISPKPLIMGDVANSEAGRLAQINMQHDIPVYPTDVANQSSVTGSLLNFLNSTPLSGKEGRGAEQSDALGRSATGAMGENSPVITPPVMNMAYNRLQKSYQDFGKNNDVTPQAGNDVINKIGALQNGPWSTLGEDVQKRLSTQINNNILPRMNNDYSIDGTDWHNIQTGLGADARKATDPEYSNALYDMQQVVRGGMRQSIPPEKMADFDASNAQYRAMLALERATKSGLGNGQVAPSALLSGTSKIYPDTIYDDKNTLPQLAQSSQLLKQAQANSDKYNLSLHRQPMEIGQLASLAATPVGALFNRSMNTQLTPLDFSHPYGAAFGRALQGQAISNNQTDEQSEGGFISRHLR